MVNSQNKFSVSQYCPISAPSDFTAEAYFVASCPNCGSMTESLYKLHKHGSTTAETYFVWLFLQFGPRNEFNECFTSLGDSRIGEPDRSFLIWVEVKMEAGRGLGVQVFAFQF